MNENDTIQLLKQCDSGTKMAVSTIDELLDKAHSSHVKHLLSESKTHHETLGNEIHTLLIRHQSEEKDPSPMAKSMSWLKTNMKMNMEESDATIADLVTDGCNMGIKTLCKYLNQYQDADDISKGICKQLIDIEEQLRKELCRYL